MVRTAPCHGAYGGSIPLGTAKCFYRIRVSPLACQARSGWVRAPLEAPRRLSIHRIKTMAVSSQIHELHSRLNIKLGL